MNYRDINNTLNVNIININLIVTQKHNHLLFILSIIQLYKNLYIYGKGDSMKKTGICPKCSDKKIIKIKDVLHSSGGGNITKSQFLFTNKNCAKITFYICENCGYIEEYLDKAEIDKLI